ncbi:phosphodiester glycosidase family protein [Chloroflexota bacterium]
MSTYTCEQQRSTYPDGNWADVSLIRCAAERLSFRDGIIAPPPVRLRDAALLRHFKARIRGEANPLNIAWACLETDQPVAQIFPILEQHSATDEHFVSANSLITYTLRTLLHRGELRWQNGNWTTQIPATESRWQQQANTVLNWLTAQKRLWLEVGPDTAPPTQTDFAKCDPLLHLSPVGRCGFIRAVMYQDTPAAAFNTSFFLLEHDDYISHHSALGDPYGLLVTAGIIIRPPLYNRSTLWQDAAGNWQTSAFSMADISLTLPDGTCLPPAKFAVNPPHPTPVAIYTRYFGMAAADRALGQTPVNNTRLEFTIIDRQIVSWQRGGELTIPQNGFVLSFDEAAFRELTTDTQTTAIDEWLGDGKITYDFANTIHQGIKSAMQNGPLLIQDGQIVITDELFVTEEYWISRDIDGQYVYGVVPTEYPIDAAQTRAARIGIGVDAQGEIIILALSGSSKGVARPGIDSVGATLYELAEQLHAAGCVQAINLDGGGSTQVFVEGGLYNTPGDRRGRPGVTYERMLPTIGVVD